MTAVDALPQPVVTGDGQPFCPFCGGVMAVSEDRSRLVCVACDCDALLEDGAR